MQRITKRLQKTFFTYKTWKAMRWLATVMLVLVGISSPALQNEAKADAGYAYNWQLDFAFEGTFDGTLYVEVGHNDNGKVQQPALHGKKIRVSCQPVGAVGLAGSAAVLQGGYLECDFDLKSALEATFEECEKIESGCTMVIPEVESYPNFRMYANVFSTVEGAAPLFYHKDASYTINPTTHSLSLSALLAAIGTVNGTPVTVPEITPPGTLSHWQTYTSRYLCEIGCNMHFGISGAAETIPLPGDGPVEFATTSTRIYIGYDQASGLIAPASTAIEHLTVDPPKFGNN